MERERSVAEKRPAKRRYAVAGAHARAPTGVSLQARIKEYPKQGLVESAGVLKCSVCAKQTLQNIKSSIETHLKSEGHQKNLMLAQERLGQDADLRSELISHYTTHPEESGSSVDPSDAVYRVRVVEGFLCAGIPLSKVDQLRPLLERSGHKLVASTHLARLVPKVEAMEFKRMLAELDGQHISLAFDGTTRLGEAVNIVARFTTADYRVVTRLVRFVTLSKHVDGAGLAGLLTTVVMQQLRLPLNCVVGFMRDSAAVNGAAVGMLGMFTSATNLMCVSHTLNNAGSRLSFPHLGVPFLPHGSLSCTHTQLDICGQSA